ncbi:MAG: hypothetical protein KDK91_03175 [Gammaproteobacteria bacterium]|nr:hypothetical protein [Gammaproteobacteria bacterium]
MPACRTCLVLVTEDGEKCRRGPFDPESARERSHNAIYSNNMMSCQLP